MPVPNTAAYITRNMTSDVVNASAEWLETASRVRITP